MYISWLCPTSNELILTRQFHSSMSNLGRQFDAIVACQGMDVCKPYLKNNPFLTALDCKNKINPDLALHFVGELMNNTQEEFLGELRLGRKLTNLGQTAAGGLVIFLGLLFLLADPVLALVGPRAALAGFLVIVVLISTAVSVIELLGGSGERGGTYVLVHEILGGWSAFLTGWGLLAGSVLALAGLLTMAAVQLVEVIPGLSLEPRLVTLLLLALLVLIQIFQLSPRSIRLTTVAILLSGLLVLVLITTLPDINLALFRNAPRLQISTLNHAIGLLSISYVAIESLLSSRRLIRDPGRHLPGAIFTILVIGGLLSVLVFFILSGISTPSQIEGSHLINDLAVAGFLPLLLIRLLIFSFLLLAANGCLMTATRQLNLFSLEGAVPAGLRRMLGPVPMPVLLFLLIALLATPLILFFDQERMIAIGAGLFLLVMTVLNFAAIYSLRTEPERRRFFEVPFAPLIPALAIVLNLVILRALPGKTLLWGFGWLLIGLVYYFLYARYHQVEAQEGEVVFGRVRQVRDREARYRILVPIASGEERQIVLRVATSLSHQLNGEVIPLQIIEVPDPLAIEEGRRIARERNTLFRWSTRIGDRASVPIHPITRLARNISEGIIDTAIEEDCNLVLLSWAINRQDTEARIGQVLNTVVREAPCDVLVVAYKKERLQNQLQSIEAGDGRSREAQTADGEYRFRPSQILVPTSGGPNAPLGIRLALLLAREFDAKVTTIYAADIDAGKEEIEQGERRIQQTIEAMREQAAELPAVSDGGVSLEDIHIEGKVIRSENVVEGIAHAGEAYDLTMLGASEESLIDQVLFGSIPEQVALMSETPVIIVKRYQGLSRLWLRRFWNTIYDALPTLNREEQIEVYRETHRGARPDVDFFVMMGLSTLIATFGLLQNSSAVIIGAMLVAPLFSPLIALGLAIVQGNVRLLRLAIESTLKGVALSIGLASLLAIVAPFKNLTPEINARSLPNLYDLAVAVASGAAGAYAVARKDVAAALPGVAIAAAMVPPLGVIGIGLALGNLALTGGAILLFATNLVAIALAGSLTFLLLGFRPGGHAGRETHLRRGLVTTIVLFVLVSIPLGFFLVQSIDTSSVKEQIQTTVVQEIEKLPDIELVSQDNIQFSTQDQYMLVTIPIYTTGPVPKGVPGQLSQKLTEAIHHPVKVRLVIMPIIQSQP